MTETTPRHLPVNTILQNGKYEILKVLGQGGFGITYLANHEVFGEVALKELFLNSGTAHCSRENTTRKQVVAHFGKEQFQKFKDRFLGEAKTLYQLSGVKGVVNVLDHFEENDTVYFSMNFLRGENLYNYVKNRGRLRETEGVKIIKSLAATLSEIHKRDILHRDIKPANIIIDEKGEAHFIDFGIARSYVDDGSDTHTTFHSPRYSPPEQKIARSRMGTFSDVYSLGATAYYIFTGKEVQKMEERLLGEGYKSPKEYVPTLSNVVDDTITRSLTIKDKERIQTADEFLLALSPIGETSRVVPPIPINVTGKDTSSSSIPNLEEKTIVETSPQLPPVDERTVVDPNAETNPIIKDDKTRLHSLPIEKELVDEEKTKIYEETAPEKKSKKWLIIVGTLVMAFLGLVFMATNGKKESSVVVAPPPPPPSVKRVLNLSVLDTFNQAIENATITIYRTGQIVKRDSTGAFSLDITKNWQRLKDQTLTVSNTGFFSKEVKIADIVNKQSTIKLTPNAVPNPQLFCDNLVGNWGNANQEQLEFKVCEGMNESSPEGLAYFNKKEAIWSSFQKEDGSIYIDFSFVESDEELLFLVQAPFDKNATKIELLKEGEVDIFTRKKKVVKKKTYIVKGRIVDNNGRAVIGASIKLPNSSRKRETVNNGNFYIELSEELWNQIKNDNIEVTYEGFELKKIRISEVINRNRYKKFVLKPVKIIGEPITPRIYVNCKNLLSGWVNNRGDQLFLENCNGGKGGKAIYNGIEKNWTYSQKENSIRLKFIGSSEPLEFLVHNPSQKNNTYLELVRQGSTPFKIGKGLIYSRKTKAKILCENISKKWTRSKTFGSEKLEITGCNTVNPSGTALYNGKSATWLSSHIVKGMTITVNHGDETLILKVHNPLSMSKIFLEIIENGDSTGKVFKK